MIENQIDPLMIVCLFWASYDPPLSYHQHGWNGSEAAKVDLLERMAALSQEAELNRARPSVLICSQFGQQQSLSDDCVAMLLGKSTWL
jgi:hypothetical protein